MNLILLYRIYDCLTLAHNLTHTHIHTEKHKIHSKQMCVHVKHTLYSRQVFQKKVVYPQDCHMSDQSKLIFLNFQ